ncbi:MAG: type II secretion system protein [Sedimentisphaerales bacterium]|nr:type II secretion system protein [Sedimentisphaerales bacterium]
MRAKKGFTLVEILIVVVILGILAAIVIPQFTDASTEAKTSSLCSDLQSMRSQIELYKIQHNDNLPGTVSGVTFAQSMTGYTLSDGTLADPQAPADGVYGPYLQKIPSNQFIPVAANQNVVTAAATTPDAPDNSSGWIYNTATGEVRANDTYDTNVHWSL